MQAGIAYSYCGWRLELRQLLSARGEEVRGWDTIRPTCRYDP